MEPMKRARAIMASLVLVVALPSAAEATKRKPIIVVFTVTAKGVKLTPGVLDRLSDYLATAVSATGRFQVVPRAQLKKRLVRQKTASYRRCYDQSPTAQYVYQGAGAVFFGVGVRANLPAGEAYSDAGQSYYPGQVMLSLAVGFTSSVR